MLYRLDLQQRTHRGRYRHGLREPDRKRYDLVWVSRKLSVPAYQTLQFYARRGGGAFVMTPFSPGPMQLPITGKPQPLQDLSSSSVGFECKT